MPVSGDSDGASTNQAVSTSGWLGKRPAIIGRAAKPFNEGPARPCGQSMPGISWQAAQPTRSITARPRVGSAPAMVRSDSGLSPHAASSSAAVRSAHRVGVILCVEPVSHPAPFGGQTPAHGDGSGEGTARVGRGWFGVRPIPLILAIAAAAACSPVDRRAEEVFSASGEIIAMGGGDGGPANACFSCHGLDGAGDGVSVPRLAGLDAGYLQKQLSDYAIQTRSDPVMSPIARWLDDGDRRAVAAWYAAMPSPAASPAATPPTIWLRGAPERGVAACASCHGGTGQGLGAGNPAISGQPAAYTLDQLRRWKAAERRNDPRGVMAAAVAGLTEAEMRAIAAWLEGAPTAPPPASDAASASASGAVAAESAASRGARRPGR